MSLAKSTERWTVRSKKRRSVLRITGGEEVARSKGSALKRLMQESGRTREHPAKYSIGERVLVEMNPDQFNGREVYLPGTIEECLGIKYLHNGRVHERDVSFPVEHHYKIGLKEGGFTVNCESRIVPDPRRHRG